MKLVTKGRVRASRGGRNFNPHEREARDAIALSLLPCGEILIHTSVKLVTLAINSLRLRYAILIHTSVKLVTDKHQRRSGRHFILIHTSVKLVTHRNRRKQPRNTILIHTSVKLVTLHRFLIGDENKAF